MEFEDFDTLVQGARSSRAVQTFSAEGFQVFDSWLASEADIELAETELNVVLPEKYKEFMRRYGGGVFLFVELLPVVSPDGRAEDLIEVSKGNLRNVGFVAVAPVGTGDWWGFSVYERTCEDAVSMMFHDDGTTDRVANDFLEFVAEQVLRVGK